MVYAPVGSLGLRVLTSGEDKFHDVPPHERGQTGQSPTKIPESQPRCLSSRGGGGPGEVEDKTEETDEKPDGDRDEGHRDAASGPREPMLLLS